MGFPFSYSKKFNIKKADSSRLLDKLENNINRAGGVDIKKDDKEFSFKGGLFRWETFKGMGWNILQVITKGQIQISKDDQYLKYKIYFTEFLSIWFLIYIFLLLFPNLIITDFQELQDEILPAIFVTLIYWTVYSFNCFIQVWRLNYRINRLIIDLNREYSDSFISSEQKSWLENENQCPACGYSINQNDIECSDCGLILKQTDNV
ncbi:MAG: hypothetical protein ACNS60_13400 [Candidatus Cyclobacteriaceae bacterium M2_1C_046]